MRHRTCNFPTGPEGHIQHWLAAGLFADLVVPSAAPAEGELTAGEAWTLHFTRFRRVRVPGYKGQEGAWWLAVCSLRSDAEQVAGLEIVAPEGTKVCAGDGRGWAAAEEGLEGLRLGPKPTLIVVAVPARGRPQAFSARLRCRQPEAVEVLLDLEAGAPLRIRRVAGRDVWVRHEGEPCPTIWFEALNITGRTLADISVRLVAGEADVELADNLRLAARSADLFEVPYPADFPAQRGTVVITSRGKSLEFAVTLPRTDHDWEVHVVSHFHYDPVWWNTQANYVERDDRSAFNLIERYIEAADDPDFTFVLEQVPYTKPYWDAFPHRRAALRELIEQGRCEVVGVLYNEPQTTLTGPETTIRNICYGVEYHRRQWKTEARTAWMLDVFGHDPNFAQHLVRAGRRHVAYARGPYKRCWGIPADRLGFPVDYWWMSPDGSRVIARLLEPGSYGLGNSLRSYDGPYEAWWEVADLFENAADYPAAHLQVWTLGGDFTPPLPWLGELARRWNRRHVSPRLYPSVPARFFSRLERLESAGEVALPPMTRDLDPVNNGCDVSYVDTKIANRLCEAVVYEAEALATVAALEAHAEYPAAELDLAWRQLLFNAHHDALTGSESDQVYVDIVGGWREAYEMATAALESALAKLTAPPDANGEGITLTVFNTLPWRRDGVVEAPLPDDWEATEATVVDGEQTVAAEVVDYHGTKVLRFVCRDVPAMGGKTVLVKPGEAEPAPELKSDGLTIENEYFRVQVDPARGGGICSIVDKATGRELVQEGKVANDLVAHKEYPELPGYGEGPWHICTTGEKVAASQQFPAEVTVEETPARVSLVVESDHVGCRRKMRITLWAGLPLVDFETYIYNYADEDYLFKVHFPLALAGGRPVYEVGGPAVSRSYCPFDPDTKQMPWTQDNAANHYVDLTVPLVIEGRTGIDAEVVRRLSAGMAEVVCAADKAGSAAVEELVRALASVGVTATVTWPQYRRFGDIAWDSNVPDFRVFIGSPEDNECVANALGAAGRTVEAELRDWVASHGWVVALLTDVELGLPVELPVLIVWGADEQAEREAIEHVAMQVREGAKIGALVPAPDRGQGQAREPAAGGVAIVNRGNLSYCCYPDQTLTLSLMRSCTGWPSGLWIDGPRRTCPDGSGFQLEHWGHCFRYALACHDGHWRDSGLGRLGWEVNRPLIARWGDTAAIEAGRDYLAVEPASVVALSFKPATSAVGLATDAVAPGKRVVLRLQETSGRPTVARVRLTWPVGAAWKGSVLEDMHEELVVDGGTIEVPLGQFECATVIAELAREEPIAVRRVPGGPAVYARWWRYNRGAAPVGFVPAAVFVEPAEPVEARAGETLRLKVTAAACYASQPQKVAVRVEVPQGWSAQPQQWEVELGQDEWRTREVAVSVPPDAAPGQYLVTAWLDGPIGPRVYDVVQVAVAEQVGEAFEATIEPVEVQAREGASVQVRVRNLTGSPLSGEVTLVAPVEAWELVQEASRQFEVPPHGDVQIEFRLQAPARELHGWVWALAKVMAAGRVAYTPAVRLDLPEG